VGIGFKAICNDKTVSHSSVSSLMQRLGVTQP
jgi:hypothetical protein